MGVYKQKEKGFNAWVERTFKNKPDAFVTALIAGLVLGAIALNPLAKYILSFLTVGNGG
jgi:hypothetical protein